MSADRLPEPGDPSLEADEPHPDVQRVMADRERLRPLPIHRMGARGVRLLTKFGMWLADADPPAVATADFEIPGPAGSIPVRRYRPSGAGPFPTVVFFHGGGFVLGSLDTHDLLCRYLAVRSDCEVVSVEYRLAPEHPFPAAVEDAYAAVEWAADEPGELDGDGRLVVAGDSAGGNLAAVTSLLATENAGPAIDHQLLVYPAVAMGREYPSVRDHAGHVLEAADMEWFNDCYFGSDLTLRNPCADPMEACDLSGLPPGTVVTAGFDPLRDGGVAYARRLDDEGVPVRLRNYPDMVHGFLGMLSDSEDVDTAHGALVELADDLRNALDVA
jgi:acetyl esterase